MEPINVGLFGLVLGILIGYAACLLTAQMFIGPIAEASRDWRVHVRLLRYAGRPLPPYPRRPDRGE